MKKYCNYCKKPRHIIRDYPTRPRPRNHQATVSSSSSTTSDSSILTSEMVKQIIISVFSTLGLQGKNFISLKYWLVDYGASNHIISFVDTIHNIWSYSGSL